MILDLDEKYRIVSDEYNFILQKRTDPQRGPNTRKGKKLNKTGGWKDVGYWQDLSQLLLSYSRQKLRASGVTFTVPTGKVLLGCTLSSDFG